MPRREVTMANNFVNSIVMNGEETQIQDYGRDQPNGVPVLDPQGKLPKKYIPVNAIGGGLAFVGTRAEYEVAKLLPEGKDGYIGPQTLVTITDEDDYIMGESK